MTATIDMETALLDAHYAGDPAARSRCRWGRSAGLAEGEASGC